MDKTALRALIRQRRRGRSTQEQQHVGAGIAARAVAFLPREPGDVTCFVSLPGEPPTGPLIETVLERGHRIR